MGRQAALVADRRLGGLGCRANGDWWLNKDEYQSGRVHRNWVGVIRIVRDHTAYGSTASQNERLAAPCTGRQNVVNQVCSGSRR